MSVVASSLQLPVSTPNSSSHFAVGDLISWSGIKRCGAAMHEGYLAAVNAHKLMQQRLYGTEPAFQELKPIPPMIGLAVGKDALSYGPGEGVQSGARVAEIFFGDDLGFSSESLSWALSPTPMEIWEDANELYSLLELPSARDLDEREQVRAMQPRYKRTKFMYILSHFGEAGQCLELAQLFVTHGLVNGKCIMGQNDET
jgi:hypothetical protein